MTRTEQHAHNHADPAAHHPASHDRRWQRDWRLWLGVLIMLGAITAYVMSLDESVQPGGARTTPPAATETGHQP